jgi:TetR/AcrR family transcriptional repressor of mexCD-oprJ operon
MTVAILNQAAKVLADDQDTASLADIARAAGVARSTLYRYFPNREVLLQALTEQALCELRARIQEAEIDILPFSEAIARVTRGFLATGTKYVALANVWPKPTKSAESEVNEPLIRLIGRGIKDGSIRGGLQAEVVMGIYGDMIKGAILRAKEGDNGVEQSSAAILDVLFEGILTKD